MKRIILLCILLIGLSCKKSNALLSNDSSFRTIAKLNENQKILPINGDTKIIFTDKKGNYWTKPKLIIKNDTLAIKNWDEEWGSELDIRISPNKKYFVIDAIISNSVEDYQNNVNENYTCRLISVERTMIIDSFQSDCDGEWNSNNQWISDNEILFSAQNMMVKYINKKCENNRFSIRIEDNRYEILDKGKIISKGNIQGDMKKESQKIKLGKIETVFYEDSLVIENYKNSDISKAHFIQCKSKYLTFEKQE